MIKELACYFLSSQTVRARMFLSYSVFTGLVNGEIIPFFPQRFHFEFSSSWAGIPLKTISNKPARHMFLSVTLSFLSFGSRVEDRTTLYARVHRIASPYDFEEESRDPETGVQRGSRQIDNSERFSKDSERTICVDERYLHFESVFTGQINDIYRSSSSHASMLCMCFFVRSFLRPATS